MLSSNSANESGLLDADGAPKAEGSHRRQRVDAEVGADLQERAAAIRLIRVVHRPEDGPDEQRIPVAGRVHRAGDGLVGRADQHAQPVEVGLYQRPAPTGGEKVERPPMKRGGGRRSRSPYWLRQ